MCEFGGHGLQHKSDRLGEIQSRSKQNVRDRELGFLGIPDAALPPPPSSRCSQTVIDRGKPRAQAFRCRLSAIAVYTD